MRQIINFKKQDLEISIPITLLERGKSFMERNAVFLIALFLSALSINLFIIFYKSGLGLAYNDARSHLDIGRRVVEGLKPGLAQIGSVWLPLPHLLMIPTIWIDFFWHSGLSGALQSMASFVATAILIYLYLKELNVGLLGRFFGVLVFIANLNILYLASTAMTELLLLATMTAGAYYLLLWYKREKLIYLLKCAFMVMVSTLVRYDGWFLFLFITVLLILATLRRKGYSQAEGTGILFATLGAFGILLWFLWNLLIFKDPLYFIFGPFSAHTQQKQIFEAGELLTKGNLPFSTLVYSYSVGYNSYTITAILGLFGALSLWRDKIIKFEARLATFALTAPFFFNILALYLGHSVLFVEGLFPYSWFNVRYGMMLIPSIAIFVGFLFEKAKAMRWVYTGIFLLVSFFAFANFDLVTVDDALIGASGKNVTEVSSWLRDNVTKEEGLVLISVASHDAIIFSSGLPMKRFIHEGTGKYWELATKDPDKWAKWIVLRTNDTSDWTFREVKDSPGFAKFELINHYPFADIYQLKSEYWDDVITEPILGRQK